MQLIHILMIAKVPSPFKLVSVLSNTPHLGAKTFSGL